MCGFAGFVEFSKPQAGSDDLAAMQRTIAHRGPNDRGHFFEPGIGLCHTRLSIVDLSERAHQPMQRDEYLLVYNGEIYNFRELRKELEGLGRSFISKSDTEVVLQALGQWGQDALMRFNGMFALCLYDKKRGKLFLARDRSGVKPLFYYKDSSFFAFGSEIKAIAAYPGFKRELSLRGLEDYLSLGHTTGRQTIWENCFRLPPGHFMNVDVKEGITDISPYWEPFFKSGHLLSFPETSKELTSLLISEFEQSLVSDVPVGACISGGVDSNVLISILSKELNVKLKTYSVSSRESEFDENKLAGRVADHLGLEHTAIYLDADECRESLLGTVVHYDEPFADQNIISFRAIAQAASRDGLPVLLSGMGGDELFYGYPNVDLRAKMPTLYTFPSFLRRSIPRGMFRQNNKIYKSIQLSQQDSYLAAIENISGNCFYGDEIDSLLVKKDIQKSSFYDYFKNSRYSSMSMKEKVMMCDYGVFLAEHGLVMADISSMAEGIEVRVPYLNNRVLDLAFDIPAGVKKHKGVYKALLREIEGVYLPKDRVYKGKRGFYPFIKSVWLDKYLSSEMNKYITQERFRSQGLFNYKAMEDVLWLHRHSKVNMGNKIWNMLIFQIWAQSHL